MDPATDKGLEILEYIKLFLDHSVPLRLVVCEWRGIKCWFNVCGVVLVGWG